MDDIFNPLTSATIQQWEEAGVLAASALGHYSKLTKLLDEGSRPGFSFASDLTSRIDLAFQTIHTTLDQQLNKIRATLAKTRNKLASFTYRFPEEVLCKILMIAVFDCGERLYMNDHILTIYRHLYTIMSVCTAWRDICITRQSFWSIIPILDLQSNRNRHLYFPLELSLQRAGQKGLNLAMFLREGYQNLGDNLSTMKLYSLRFSTLNIHSDSDNTVASIFDTLLEYGALEQVSKLSLRYSHSNRTMVLCPCRQPNRSDCHIYTQFTRLVASLSALRVSNINLYWDDFKFSRLVEICLHKIRIAGASAVESLMAALASAHELRDFKVINIRASSEKGLDLLPSFRVFLPKLQYLHLEDLCLNVMVLFLATISTAEPYNTTLNLSNASSYSIQGIPGEELFIPVAVTEACAALAPFPINRLILQAYGIAWGSKYQLHTLLESLPNIKTLVMNKYRLDNEVLEALVPRSSQQGEGQFPRLETIEFRSAKLSDEIQVEQMKNVVAHHPIQKLVLGGVRSVLGLPSSNLPLDLPLEDSVEFVGWLKYNVPGFRLIQGEDEALDCTETMWQLWDI